MKDWKSKKWLIPVIFLVGISVVWRSGVFAGDKNQKASTPVQTVKTIAAQYVDIVPGLEFNGTMEGQATATISAKIAGRIEQVLVQEGQQVKAGDPLIQLEAVELANTVRQAGDMVRKAQASYELALNDFNRYQTLYDKGAVSEQQLDNAKAKLKTAEADLSSAAANQSNARQQYSYGVINSPINGVVANKTASVGQVVSPGAALMVVQNIDQLYAVINVEQKDLGRVQTGQTASIHLDAYPDRIFTGVVEVMNPEAGSVSRMFRTKIKVDNSEKELMPGMFAKVKVAIGASAQVLTVPQSAIVQKQGLYYIFVLDGDKAVQRQIEIGDMIGTDIMVKEGLEPGQQVIVTNVNRLKTGETVRVTK